MLRRLAYLLFPSARVRVTSAVAPKGRALLLGWGGSVPKNLKKIEEYYLSRNVSVLSFIMPLLLPGFLRDEFEAALCEKLEDSKLLGVHLFSNNGSWVYSSLSRRGVIPPEARVIFDSAPMLWYEDASIVQEAQGYTRVITSVILRQNVYHHPVVSPVVAAILPIFIAMSRTVEWLQTQFFYWFSIHINIVPDLKALNFYLRDAAPIAMPMLFLYAKGDQLIPPQIVAEHIAALRKRGAVVQEHVFENHVPHTGAFFKEGEAYKAIVDKFFSISHSEQNTTT